LKKLLLILSISIVSSVAYSQNLTGIWRGYFVTETMDQYKFEVQMEQTNSTRLTGVTYSYLDTRFYGKATLTGYYNKPNKTALVQEIKTIELKMAGSSIACIMKFNFTYSRSGNEEFLEGVFTSAYETSNSTFGVKKGGSCGGGKAYLRKVATSDFYVEPFLRDNPVVKKPAQQSTTKPAVKPPVEKTTTTPKTENKTVAKPPVKNPANTTVTTKPKTETIKETPANIDEPKTTVVPKAAPSIPLETRSRKNELTQTINVRNEKVTIKLYDNGEIDGDTISVYLDNKIILSNKMLTAAPLTISLDMEEEREYTLVMVAENLGRIPPNTSLMVVHDGDKRYEVRITATEQKNAMVRFRYQKKNN
jgi:hypothetical protein